MKVLFFIPLYLFVLSNLFSTPTGVIKIMKPTSEDDSYYYLRYTYWVTENNIPLRGNQNNFYTENQTDQPIYIVDSLIGSNIIVNGITFYPQQTNIRQYKGPSGDYVLNFIDSNVFTVNISKNILDQVAFEILLSQIYLIHESYYYSYVNNQYVTSQQYNDDGYLRERIDIGSNVYLQETPGFVQTGSIVNENLNNQEGVFVPILLFVTESRDLKLYFDYPATNHLRFEFAAPFLSNFVSFYYYQASDGTLLKTTSNPNYTLSTNPSSDTLSDENTNRPLIQYLSSHLQVPPSITYNKKNYSPIRNFIERKKDYQLDVSGTYWLSSRTEQAFTMMSSQFKVYYDANYEVYTENYKSYFSNGTGYVIFSLNTLDEKAGAPAFYILPPSNISTSGNTKNLSNTSLPIYFEFTNDGYFTVSEGVPPGFDYSSYISNWVQAGAAFAESQVLQASDLEGAPCLSY